MERNVLARWMAEHHISDAMLTRSSKAIASAVRPMFAIIHSNTSDNVLCLQCPDTTNGAREPSLLCPLTDFKVGTYFSHSYWSDFFFLIYCLGMGAEWIRFIGFHQVFPTRKLFSYTPRSHCTGCANSQVYLLQLQTWVWGNDHWLGSQVQRMHCELTLAITCPHFNRVTTVTLWHQGRLGPYIQQSSQGLAIPLSQ